MAYSTMFTEEEMAAYRKQQADEKAKAAEEAAKTQEQKAKEASKKKRAELEASLKSRFIASGGTDGEWVLVKRRLIEDALARVTLEPEAEPEPVRADPPLPRSRYMK